MMDRRDSIESLERMHAHRDPGESFVDGQEPSRGPSQDGSAPTLGSPSFFPSASRLHLEGKLANRRLLRNLSNFSFGDDAASRPSSREEANRRMSQETDTMSDLVTDGSVHGREVMEAHPAAQPAILENEHNCYSWHKVNVVFQERNPIDMLVWNMQRATLLPSRSLEELHAKGIGRPKSRGFVDSVLASFYSSAPLTFWISIPWVRLLLILAASVLIGFDAWSSRETDNLGPSKFPYYRFTALERRDGKEVTSAGIGSFGMLEKDASVSKSSYCTAQSIDVGVHQTEGASMTLAMEDTTKHESYSGWYFMTGMGPVEEDPVRFMLEGSYSKYDGWEPVGSSSMVIYKGTRVLLNGRSNTTQERGAKETMMIVAPMPLQFGYNISWMFFWIIILGASIAAHFGFPRVIKPALLFGCCSVAITQAVSGIILLSSSWPDGFYLICTGTTVALTGVAYWYHESQFDAISLVTCLVGFILNLIYNNFVTGDMMFLVMRLKGGIQSFYVPFLLCLIVVFVRIKMVHVAVQMLAKDKQLYHGVWLKLMSDESKSIEGIQKLIEHLQKGRSQYPRQYAWRPTRESRSIGSQTSSVLVPYGPRELSGTATATSAKHAGTALSATSANHVTATSANHVSVSRRGGLLPRYGSPVSSSQGAASIASIDMEESDEIGLLIRRLVRGSVTESTIWGDGQTNNRNQKGAGVIPLRRLDTLHSQALLLDPVLLSLARTYAHFFNGLFPVAKRSPEWVFERWPLTSTKRAHYFELGTVKEISRCIDKMDMAYAGDASRLLDICRQSIYFVTVRDLLDCLTSLASDPLVEIVRVKTSLVTEDLDSDPLFSGMRFVKVNLRLKNDVARIFCVEYHTAELLLIPAAFAHRQTVGMYNRYIIVRNSVRGMWRFHFARRLFVQRAGAVKLLPTGLQKTEVGTKKRRQRFSLYSLGGSEEAVDENQRLSRKIVSFAAEEGIWPPMVASVGHGSRELHAFGNTTSQGIEVTPRMTAILTAYCRLSASGLSNMLDASWLERLRKTFSSMNTAAVIATRMPLTGFSIQGAFQASAMLCAIYLFACGCISWALMSKVEQYAYSHYRMHTLATRNGTLAPADGWGRSVGFASFGVLARGECAMMHLEDLVITKKHVRHNSTNANQVVTRSDGPVGIMGWWIMTTADGPKELDASRYIIFGTNDPPPPGGWCLTGGPGEEEEQWCGAQWSQVGGPVWRLPDVVGSVVSGDWLNFARSLGRHLPDKRGSIQSFHVRPSRSWAIHTIGVSLLESAALFVFAVVGRYGVSLRDLPLVELGTVISFILLGCVTCELVAGATFLWEGFTENGLECLARAPSLLSLAAGAFWETHLLGFGWIAVLLDLALNFTVIHQVYGSARNTIPFPVLGTGLLIIMLLLYCLFWNTKRLGRQQVRNDENEYDMLWGALRADDDDKGFISALEIAVDSLCLSHVRQVRQLQRASTSDLTEVFSRERSADLLGTLNPVFKGIRYFPIPGTLRLTSRVKSMDQLYAQASVCSIALASKVRKWAAVSHGLFPVSEQGASIDQMPTRYQECDPGGESDESPQCLMLAARAIKSRRRAISKLMMCYEGDPSRLVDLARNRIVFRNINDLTKCFLAVAADSEIRIERVKNRLTPSYDPAQTAGYRDVCINLRLLDPSVVVMGADTHVCELQLALKVFIDRRSTEADKRFTNWRNYRNSLGY